MINSLESFFTSFSMNNESGILTLISDLESREINLYGDVDMNSDSIENGISIIRDDVANQFLHTPQDGSYLIPVDESAVLFRERGIWIKIYDKSTEDNYFKVPYYSQDKNYSQNEIVSFKLMMYKTVENNVMGEYPDTIVVGNEIMEAQLSTVNVDIYDPVSMSTYGDRIAFRTASEVYSVNKLFSDVSYEADTVSLFPYNEFFSNRLIIEPRSIRIDNELFTYAFEDDLRMVFCSSDFMYVIDESATIIKVFEYGNAIPLKLVSYVEPVDFSDKISGSLYNDSIILTSHGSSNIAIVNMDTELTSLVTMNFNDILSSIIINEDIFILREDHKIYQSQLIQSKWKKVTLDDIFDNSLCQDFYLTDISFENSIVNSKPNIVNHRASAFEIFRNKFLFVAQESEIVRIDISNGVLGDHGDRRYMSIPNGNITGLAVFNQKLYVSQGNEIKYITEIDMDTFQVLRTIDLSSMISGTNIQDLDALGDTLYVLTNNGVVYSFGDVDIQYKGAIDLEHFTSKSKMVAVGKGNIYQTNYRVDIQVISLVDKRNGRILESSMGIDVDSDVLMCFSNNSFYTLDVNNNNTLSMYNRIHTAKLISQG